MNVPEFPEFTLPNLGRQACTVCVSLAGGHARAQCRTSSFLGAIDDGSAGRGQSNESGEGRCDKLLGNRAC